MLLVEIIGADAPFPVSDLLWMGHMERPDFGSCVEAAAVEMRGWVVGRASRVTGVEVLVDGQVAQHLPLLRERPDIQKAFPGVEHSLWSGFHTAINLEGRTQVTEVVLRAVLADGQLVPFSAWRARRRWQSTAPARLSGVVSVIIPCYNQAHFLPDAIESALAQTHVPVEVIVVDDGSTDDTSKVAESYANVRLVRQRNQGLAAARNAGLRASRGDHIIFLDADDQLLPDAASSGIQALEQHPECAMAVGQGHHMDTTGRPLETPATWVDNTDHYAVLLNDCFVWMPAMAIYHRGVFHRVGGFDRSVNASADYDLYLRIARRYGIATHDQVVARYRKHGGNMTRRSALMLRSAIVVLRRQWTYAKNDPVYLQSFLSGMHAHREDYGKQLVNGVWNHLRSREWGPALPGLLALARFYPGGFAFVARRFLKRIFGLKSV
jgi:glycosyltransferase involved in cell wall biosynthesis